MTACNTAYAWHEQQTALPSQLLEFSRQRFAALKAELRLLPGRETMSRRWKSFDVRSPANSPVASTEGFRRCMHAQINRGDISEDELAVRREKAMADPNIQNILTDPVMRQVIYFSLYVRSVFIQLIRVGAAVQHYDILLQYTSELLLP